MAKRRRVDVPFPLGGLNRRQGYQSQPPYSSPSCLNVRAIDTIEERQRGGSRPGLLKSHITDLGSEVRLLAPMTLALGGNFSAWSDNFDGTELSSVWAQASWSDDVPLILPTGLASIDSSVDDAAIVLGALTIDTSEIYTIEALLVPWAGEWHGSYHLYLRLDDTTPDIETDGILVELTQTGLTGAYTASLKSYDGGDETETDTATGTDSSLSPAWLSVTVDGDDITVYWNGNEILSGSVDTHTGSRVGFGLSCSVDGGLCLLNTFRVQYYTTGDAPTLRSMLIVSAGGNLWYESTYGSLSQVVSDLDVRDDTLLQSTQSGQKLYIADYGNVRATGTDGTVSGAELDSATYADWSTLGIDVDTDVVVISNEGGATVAGTYTIDSVAAGAVTLTSAPGDGTCSFRIERGPKVFDPATQTLTLMTADTGQVPTGCSLIARHLDRVFLAGAAIAPHVWYCARQSDELDWDYSQEDSQAAVAGTASSAGVPGEAITALIPHTDDYLVIGCRNSMWRLLGDPAADGSLYSISRTIGVIGANAWCWSPKGELIFLSLNGLYVVSPYDSDSVSYPVPISPEILPREFRNINPDTTICSLEFNNQAYGVHIFLTSIASNQRKHWFVDWSNQIKTFWPVSLNEDHEPTCTCMYQSVIIEDSGIILGCRDGFLRRFSDLAENDDGEDFTSYVVIGPIKLAPDGLDGCLTTLDASIAFGSGDVTWEVAAGETYEEAASNSASDTGTWTEGLNATVYPACRGQAFTLTITGGAGRKWAFENLVTTAKPSGKRRII